MAAMATALGLTSLSAAATGASVSAESKPASQTFLLAMGKGRPVDPAVQQERAIDAVEKVTGAASSFQPSIHARSLAEAVMTQEAFRRGEVEATVNGAVFHEQLRWLTENASSEYTVIIYTHTHGIESGKAAPNHPGGIVLDPGRRGTLPWDDYAELVLAIPARNVVVLTMACYSGGLIDAFNQAEIRQRWQDRRQVEGRNLIVLTSQNRELMSPPIVKNRELINPFTYALAEALSGKADGFTIEEGRPRVDGVADGSLTAGELIDFVLHTTGNTRSEAAVRPNVAEPQVTGSFDRNDILLRRPQ